MSWRQSLRITAVGLVCIVLADVAISVLVPSIAMDWPARLTIYVLWPVFVPLYLRRGASTERRVDDS